MHAYMHTYTHPYIRSTNIDPDMRRVHVTLTSTYLHRYPYHTGTGTAHHHRQKSSPITHHLFQLSLSVRLARRTLLCHGSIHPICLPARALKLSTARLLFFSAQTGERVVPLTCLIR